MTMQTPASSAAEILDRLQEMLFTHGNPMQPPYLYAYATLFLNARKVGGPTGDQISAAMYARGAADNEHAAQNVPTLTEAWTHWSHLLEATLPHNTITIGPNDEYVPYGKGYKPLTGA